jgi:hypothetical protein
MRARHQDGRGDPADPVDRLDGPKAGRALELEVQAAFDRGHLGWPKASTRPDREPCAVTGPSSSRLTDRGFSANDPGQVADRRGQLVDFRLDGCQSFGGRLVRFGVPLAGPVARCLGGRGVT